MQQQQQNSDIMNAKNGMNLMRVLAAAMTPTITVFSHLGFGSEALGWPGLTASLLLLGTFALTANPLWLNYFLVWVAAMIFQHVYTVVKNVNEMSRYAGFPILAMIFPIKEETAIILEPILCVFGSFGLGMMVEDCLNLDLYSLSNWLFWGGMAMGVDYALYEMEQRRKLQAMSDARIQQEILMRRYEEEGR